MEPWTVKLLPNIVVDIPTARKKAKALGYRFLTKIQSFQDLAREERRIWWLEAIKSAAVIKPYASYINGSFVYRHRAAFNLVEELQGLPPLIEAPNPVDNAVVSLEALKPKITK